MARLGAADSARPGRYGCALCDEPPPHSHSLGSIYNAMYYCPIDGNDGEPLRHQWGNPVGWLKRVRCTRCGYKQRK